MAVANANAVKYAELTDEILVEYHQGIELFIKSNEYWGKWANNEKVPRGHKDFSFRRLVAPVVNKADIRERAEFIAPRPSKIALATFTKAVRNYGGKAIYSREDLQYHFDSTIASIRATLNEEAVQTLDLIKGDAFVKSKAIITAEAYGSAVAGSTLNMIGTAEKASLVLLKNKAKRWDGVHYLAHITPEALKRLRDEVRALGQVLPEARKVELDGVSKDVYDYGDFMYSVTDSPVLYKNATTQYVVYMGKRGIDGISPVSVSKLEGESNIEVIDNGLGSGVLVDEDGNYTADDNKQQGSIAYNIDGLGAAVNDDLCILDCEVSLNEVKQTALPLSEQTGFASRSGNLHFITESAGTKTHFKYDAGVFVDASDSNKAYASGNTIISVQVLADEGEAFSGGAAPTSSNWTATYKLTSGGDSINAEILAVVKTAVNYDTLIVKVPNECYSFTIASAATAD